jgi:hypothetical protein
LNYYFFQCCNPYFSIPWDIFIKISPLSFHKSDGKALEELMGHLRNFDPVDPAKYDYALFGLGAIEKF